MALLEKHRSVIYAHFVEELGEEAAQAMLDQFPVRDVDELVTKEYLAQQMAELRLELSSDFHKQTERLMTGMQVVVGVAFAVFSALVIATR